MKLSLHCIDFRSLWLSLLSRPHTLRTINKSENIQVPWNSFLLFFNRKYSSVPTLAQKSLTPSLASPWNTVGGSGGFAGLTVPCLGTFFQSGELRARKTSSTTQALVRESFGPSPSLGTIIRGLCSFLEHWRQNERTCNLTAPHSASIIQFQEPRVQQVISNMPTGKLWNTTQNTDI